MKHERNFQPAVALPGLHFPFSRGRRRTRDMLTYDAAAFTTDHQGNMIGKKLGGSYTMHDGRTCDSTGVFYVNELERLDLTMHEPLASVSYGRDMPMREDVTLGDDASSFTVSSFGSSGSLGTGQGIGNGKAWIGRNTNEISGVGVDIGKITQPLTPWGLELKYTIMELEASARAGRPIDQQKYAALQMKYQMDVDEMVYFGDSGFLFYGLVNSDNRSGVDAVTNVTNVAAGAATSTLWTMKTPDEILQDVNEILVSAWSASAWAVYSDTLLIPPAQFGYISTQKVSNAGNISILRYLMENNLLTQSGVAPMKVYPSKWCIGTGVGGTVGTIDGHDRMIVYKRDKDRVRYPMTLLQRTPVQFQSIYHSSTYYGKLGVVEIVYPETIAYRDGL